MSLSSEPLDKEDYDTDVKLEEAQEEIDDKEEAYLHEVIDRALPSIHQLLKMVMKAKPTDVPASTTVSTTPMESPTFISRMAKLKFPTFSGDIRDYVRVKELFEHFPTHLDETERLYQMVESMEEQPEKDKIKAYTKVDGAWEILDEGYGD